MSFYPITLGIGRSAANSPVTEASTRLEPLHRPTSLSADLKKTIFERDNHTCQCCGFRALKYQEALVKDGDLTNLTPSNLLTTCFFCHQCFHLDLVVQMRSGVLLWLPEIPQNVLNNLARTIYVARISQGPMADAARKSLDVLMTRREEVKKRIGTDDPYVLCTVLKDYIGNRHYSERSTKLEGVRLFPLDRRIIKETDLEFNQFPQILAYWRSKDGPYGGMLPTQWLDAYAGSFAHGSIDPSASSAA